MTKAGREAVKFLPSGSAAVLRQFLLLPKGEMALLSHIFRLGKINFSPSQPVQGVTAQNANSSTTAPASSLTVFSPIVTATCRRGIMTIKVETLNNFVGVVHSRDFRKSECSGYGENSKVTFLRVNMLAQENDHDYCGVFATQVSSIADHLFHFSPDCSRHMLMASELQTDSEERSVAVAVRTHRTLELVDDKFYMITCGKAGFQNSRYGRYSHDGVTGRPLTLLPFRNQTSLVNLQLMRKNRRVEHVVYGQEYTLRADISHPDGA